jgi:hypothetical protein
MSDWTFITNHAQVLLAIAEDPERTVADIARRAQVTERSAFRILADLQRAGYVRRGKNGRRNHYEINSMRSFRDPLIDSRPIADLISLARDRTEERLDFDLHAKAAVALVHRR